MKKIVDDMGMVEEQNQSYETSKRKIKICLIGDKTKLSSYADSLIKLGHQVNILTNRDDLSHYDIIQLHDRQQVDGLNNFLFSLDDDPVLTIEEYDECFKKSDLILIYNQIKPNYFKMGYKTFNLKPHGEETISSMMIRLEEIYYYYLNTKKIK